MTHSISRRRAFACAAVALLAPACLKAPDDGSELYSSYIVPADVDVPMLDDDMPSLMKLDANDGFMGTRIPLRTGFAGGVPVQYWDLGQLMAISIKPMWIFRRRLQDGSDQWIGHPNLIDSIPGDTPYTPLRQLYKVYMTGAWDGERIASLRALEDAIEFHLVEAPVPQDVFVNCVVTPKSMRLQDSADPNDTIDPQPTYYRGKIVHQFCIQYNNDDSVGVGMLPIKNQMFNPGNAYLLRRENELSPLDETLLKADLNEDGDMLDTNTVFDTNVGDPGYTSIWKSLDVAVPRDYLFGTSTSEDELFDELPSGLAGKADRVIQYKDNAVFLNRPIKRVLP